MEIIKQQRRGLRTEYESGGMKAFYQQFSDLRFTWSQKLG